MSDASQDPRVRAYLYLPQEVAMARFPELNQAYAVERQLVVEARKDGEIPDAVVEHVLDALRPRLADRIAQGAVMQCDATLKAEMRFQLAFRLLHIATSARLQAPSLKPALPAAQRALLIERAVALRAHERARADDAEDDGVDTFRGIEVAMGLALLDYPENLAPFDDAELRTAYEKHLTQVAPRSLNA